jgi:hypothetical protein
MYLIEKIHITPPLIGSVRPVMGSSIAPDGPTSKGGIGHRTINTRSKAISARLNGPRENVAPRMRAGGAMRASGAVSDIGAVGRRHVA